MSVGLLFLLLATAGRADMDAPRWYEFIQSDIQIDNLSEFPNLTFFSYAGPGEIGGPEYRKFTPQGVPLSDETFWTENENFSDGGSSEVPDPKSNPKFRPVAVQFYLEKYYVSTKTVTTIADPLEHITEILHITRPAKEKYAIESRRFVFTFKDGKKIDMASNAVDPKNPLFWLHPVHSFRITGTKAFSNSDFALIEAGTYRASHQKPVWDGANVKRLEEGKTYENPGNDYFYIVYSTPKNFWEGNQSPDLATEISEDKAGRFTYLGGIFTSKTAEAAGVSFHIEGNENRPKNLSSPDGMFHEESKPTNLASSPTPMPPIKRQLAGDTLPTNPDKRFFWGIPAAAALGMGLLLWLRKKRKNKI